MNVSTPNKSFWPISFGIAGSLVFVLLYYRDLQMELVQNSTGIPVGKIVKSDPEVTRRPFNRLVWLPVTNDLPVYEKDTLKTGPQSETTVELKEKGVLTLKPDSLAIIETQNREFKIHLASGDLFLSGEVQAQIGDTVVKGTKGSQFSISRNVLSGAVGVSSKEGKVTVSTKQGEQKQIEKGQILKTTEKSAEVEVQTLEYFSKLPQVQMPIETFDSQNISITFELEPLKEAQPEPMVLRVYPNSQAQKPIVSKTLNPGELKTNLILPRPSTYFWHVADIKTAKPKSALASFTIQKVERPKVIEESQLLRPSQMSFENPAENLNIVKLFVPWVEDKELGGVEALEYGFNQKDYSRVESAQLNKDRKSFELTFEAKKTLKEHSKIYLKFAYKDGKKSLPTELDLDISYFDYHLYSQKKPGLIYPNENKKWNTVALKNVAFEWEIENHKRFKPKAYKLFLEKAKSEAQVFSTLVPAYEIKKTLEPGEYVWWVEAHWQAGTSPTQSEKRNFFVQKPRSSTGSELLRAPAFVGEE
jgi:hypothetical protein